MEYNDKIISDAWRRLGAPVGYIYIMDLNGLSMHHYTSSSISILKQIQAIDDNFYPEFLRKVIVINTPTVFTLFWKIGKMVMHQQSIAKFDIRKSDYQEEVLKHITPDRLPRFLGGRCSSCQHCHNDCKFGGDKFVLLQE